ncbi:MAG: lipocalin family protein [Planctomycetes bacterium]|nr:lipocalin family protein [Planctomycetota bacterium]
MQTRRLGHIGRLSAGTAGIMLLLSPLSGCGGTLVGHWHLVQSIPNRDVFAVDDAIFNRDGSFSATTTVEGKTLFEVGTYDFSGFMLTLRPQAGGQRRFTATLKINTLQLSHAGNKAILKKGKQKDAEQ